MRTDEDPPTFDEAATFLHQSDADSLDFVALAIDRQDEDDLGRVREVIAAARAKGIRRLSLEPGTQPAFSAARGLYASAGFTDCPPFGSYRPDPNSHFMTLELG